jgi:hypothetical protein
LRQCLVTSHNTTGTRGVPHLAPHRRAWNWSASLAGQRLAGVPGIALVVRAQAPASAGLTGSRARWVLLGRGRGVPAHSPDRRRRGGRVGHFGLLRLPERPLTRARLAGVALLLAGVVLIQFA